MDDMPLADDVLGPHPDELPSADDILGPPTPEEAFPDAIKAAEHTAPGVVQPKSGARTPMQVKPATAAKPGFGVTPAQDDSDDEYERVGRDYSRALLKHYGTPALAGMAYNAGPDNVNGWLKKYGDPRTGDISEEDFIKKVPWAETRKYAGNVLKAMPPAAPLPSAEDVLGPDPGDQAAPEAQPPAQPGATAAQPPSQDPYDTRLTADEEPQFQAWKQQYAPNDSGEDYDLRGAYKAGLTPDPQTGHWPDTFKKPNHPTFSDESMYAQPPYAAANQAGHWEGPNHDIYVPAGQPYSEDEIKRLQSQVDEGRKQISDLSPKIEDIGKQLDAAKAPVDRLRTQLAPVSQAVEAMDKDLATQLSDLHDLKAQRDSGKPINEAQFNTKLAQYNSLIEQRNHFVDANADDMAAFQDASKAYQTLYDRNAGDLRTFNSLLEQDHQLSRRMPALPETSAVGAFARGAERGAIPAAGGMVGAGAGMATLAPVGAAIGTLGGPVGTAIGGTAGGLIGGIAGSFGGGAAASSFQSWLLDRLPDSAKRAMGQDIQQQKADIEKEKYPAFAGELAPNLALFRPSFGRLPPWEEGTPVYRRIFGSPVTARVMSAGIMGAQEAGQEVAQGEPLDPTKVAISAGLGALMDRPTKLGYGLMAAGAAPVAAASRAFRGPSEAPFATVTPAARGLPAPEEGAGMPPPGPEPRGASPPPGGRGGPGGASFGEGEVVTVKPLAGGLQPYDVTVLSTTPDGKYANIRYDDGRKRLVPVSFLADNAIAPVARPPVAPEVAATEEGRPITEADVFNVPPEDLEPAPEPGEDKIAKADLEAAMRTPVERGTRDAPVRAPETAADIQPARDQVVAPKSEAQAEAGNYPKGHIDNFHGMDIAVEHPRGSIRSGTAPDGTPWAVQMPADYGYIKGTTSADSTVKKKQGLDVYIGDNPKSTKAYVIDQHDPNTGKFDEPKSVVAVDTVDQARQIYDAAFSDGSGPDRRAVIKEMPIDDFRGWAKSAGPKTAIATQDIGRDVTGEVGPQPVGAPLARAVDDRGKPIFAKGERVVINDQGPLQGRHGTIAESNALVMQGLMGGKRETSYHYTVKTDEGHTTHASSLAEETKRPTHVILDPVIEGQPTPPHQVQASIGYAKQAATKAEAAAGRSRKAQSRDSWLKEARLQKEKAARHQAILDAWGRKNPEALPAIKSAEPVAPAALPKPSAPTGATYAENAEKDGVEVRFKAKPDEETLRRLKAAAYRWSSRQGLWYARRTPATLGLAKEISGKKPAPPEAPILATPTPAEYPSPASMAVTSGAATAQDIAAIEASVPTQVGPKVTRRIAALPAGVKPDWTELGKNSIGQTLYADQRGVRSYVENGIRHTEPVGIVPTRGGMEFTVERRPNDPVWDYVTVAPSAVGQPPAPAKMFYVTMVREPGPNQKVAWLAGPFATHAEALNHVDAARAKAAEVDPFTHFDAFGTASREGGNYPPGTLNEALGIKASAQAPKPGKETTPPALTVEASKPTVLADKVAAFLADHPNKLLTADALHEMAEEVYGGTLASGTIPRDEMYDALELGLSRFLRRFPSEDGKGPFSPAVDEGNAIARVGFLDALKNRLPTQTVRAGEKETHQQFSTPPDYAYAASWAAELRPTDVVLEPSAGTGSFVVPALNAGVRGVYANDLSERRAEMLRSLNPSGVTTENAEHLHAILPKEVKPTVILMNPPFSAAAGRMEGKKLLDVGANHVEEALRRLEPGGRLVAIVGQGMKPGTATFKDFWARIGAAYNVRANIGIEGGIYRKYGTTFPTRLLVIDKVLPTGRTPVVVEDIKDARGIIEALREVQSDRPVSVASEREPAQPSRPQVAGAGQGAIQPIAPVPRPTGVLGPGEGRPGAVAGGPGGVARPGQSVVGGQGQRGPRAGAGVPLAPQQPERTPAARTDIESGAVTPTGEGPLGGGSGGAGDGIQPDGSGQRVEPGVTEAPVTVRATEQSMAANVHDAPITDAIYESYKPERAVIAGAKPHPGPLVQSAAMATVRPPMPTHELAIPHALIESGALSDAQLEAVIYAGQAHSEMLPASGALPERRRGFFVGDSTGVGKGRIVSGIILDNQLRGVKKHIWVSEKKALINDARRDWSGLKQNPKDIVDHGTMKASDAIPHKHGVLFTTYDTLKSGEKTKAVEEGKTAPTGKTRVQQIIDWVGPDFDGVIAWDESHNLGNSFDMKGNRGMKKAAAKALAGIELQNALPKARIVYVSATGATEVNNLGYADRLGLWGRGTAFPTRESFLSQVSQGGVAAMELVARDMKALGSYIARSLSYEGVEYDRLEHPLTPEQHVIYDKLADAWQLVLRNFNAAMQSLGITGTTRSGATQTHNAQAKSAILSQFWGTHQRFFNQVVTSMQMPTVLTAVEKDLRDGRQAVLQLVNTNEAAQERALAKVSAEDDAEALEELDMSPRDQLLQLVSNAFPTQRFEQYLDDSGNVRSRPVEDANGNPVHDPALIAQRERLLDELGSVRVPDGPLEMLMNHFGTDKVAEVTGRKQRVVRAPDEKTGQMRTVVQKRPAASNVAEANDFQNGKKPILVFSEAGGTGRSYHADINSDSANARRSHYLVQPGWRADKAVQGFGRTHRTNQASAPIFHLVTTDLQGQRRFVSSIARRLGQLGALTKGERRTGNQGLFGLRDNLESDEAKLALRGFFNDVISGQVEGIGLNTLEDQMGLKLIDPATGRQLRDPPQMTQFLNRLLSLRTDLQNRVFNEFSRRMDDVLDRAAAAGTLDTGVETYKADKIVKKADQVVYTDPNSGAETRHVQLETSQRNYPRPFQDVAGRLQRDNADHAASFVRSVRSGKIFGVADSTPHTDKNGNIVEQKRLVGPLDYQFINAHRLDDSQFWTPLKPGEDKTAWDAHVAQLPEFNVSDLHLITGAVLPIWDRLGGNPRIYRLQTDSGERMLGRVVPNDSIADTLTRLGAEQTKITATPAQVAQRVLGGETATLANGWKIKRSLVAGEQRMELVGPDHTFLDQLRQDGVFTERINWDTRFFIPTGPYAPTVIEKVTAGRPVTQISRAAPKVEGEEPQFQVARVPSVPQTQTPAFKWWFGRSQVVDAQGRPLVVYHGTQKDFSKFKTRQMPPRGISIGWGGTGHSDLGSWFGSTPDVATAFAIRQDDINALFERERALVPENIREGGNIIPAYLSIENPKIYETFKDYAEDADNYRSGRAMRNALERAGHDGVIIRRSSTDAGPERSDFVVFRPEQIKSAVGNRGTFDPTKPDILYQKAPPFFSALTKSVEGLKQEKAPAAQWEGIIKNLPGVRQDERDWSGVDTWLRDQKGPVAKQALVDFLKANQVRLREIRRGGGQSTTDVGPQAHQRFQELEDTLDRGEKLTPDELILHRWLEEHPQATDTEYLIREYDLFLRRNKLGNFSAEDLLHDMHKDEKGEIYPLDKQREWRPWLAKFISKWTEAQTPPHPAGWEMVGVPGSWESYTLPGGSNYREVLLTLPAQRYWVNGAPITAEDLATAEGRAAADRVGSHGDDVFRSGHFPEPNIVVHLRLKDRTDPDGKKVLHAEEVQSDWHEQGRKRGYRGPVSPEVLKKREELIAERTALERGNKLLVGHPEHAAASRRNNEINDWLVAHPGEGHSNRVPDAPFKTTWHELAMKQLLRMAAEEGYDKLAWTRGEEQAERYGLAAHIGRAEVEKLPDGRYAFELFEKNGEPFHYKTAVPEQSLPEYVGKDLAERIVKDIKVPGGKTYSGLDLKLGGEGMAGFYDKMLPAFMNKYAKKWGARVGESKINTPRTRQVYEGPEPTLEQILMAHQISHLGGPDIFESPVTGQRQMYAVNRVSNSQGLQHIVDGMRVSGKSFSQVMAEDGSPEIAKLFGGDMPNREIPHTDTVHSIDITPAMRDSVMAGQPMFERGARGVAQGPAVELARGLEGTLMIEPVPAEEAVIDAVNEVMEKLAPSALVAVTKSMRGKGEPVYGASYKVGLQRVIAWALESPDAIGTARHEAVHFLKHEGFLSKDEWNTLEKAAKDGDWGKKHDINTRYPGLTPKQKLEESIAEEFSEWRRDPSGEKSPFLNRIFERIAQFLHRLAMALRQMFGRDATAEDIFAKMESGEVGQRGTTPGDTETSFQRPRRPRMPTTAAEGKAELDDAVASAGHNMPPDDIAKAAAESAKDFEPKPRPSKFLSGVRGAIERQYIFPYTLAATDWRSAKFWTAVQARNDLAYRFVHAAAEGSKKYLALTPFERQQLHAVEELDRLTGNVFPNDGTPIVAQNDLGITRGEFMNLTAAQMAGRLTDRGISPADAKAIVNRIIDDQDPVTLRRALDHLNPRLVHSKFGDIIALSPKIQDAYFERRQLFAQRWRDIMRGTAHKFGWKGEPDAGAIRKAAEEAESQSEKAKLENLAELVEAMADQERTGYVPLARNGDYFVHLSAKAADKESLDGFPRTIEFRLVESRTPFSSTHVDESKVPKAAEEAIKEMRQHYPADHYNIRTGYLHSNPEMLRKLDIPAIEKLLMVLQQTDSELYKPMVDELQKKLYEELKAGFKKRAANVQGYSPDFTRATGDYFHHTAYHVADLMQGDAVRHAKEQYINSHPDKGTQRYWDDWDIDQKRTPWGIPLQRFGFYWEMAGNLSTSGLIGLHGPEIATYTLSMGLGPKGIPLTGANLAKAYGQTLTALRASAKEGFHFPLNAIPFLKDDERRFLEDLESKGLLHSTAADELMGLRVKDFDDRSKAGQIWSQALKIDGSTVTSIDRMNRISVALTAYRMAKSPDNLKAWNKVWFGNQVYREMLQREGLTPAAMGRFLMDQSIGVWGRTNQPQMQRAIPLAFQFQGFRMRLLSAMWRNAYRMGVPGKIAVGMQMLALAAFAGVLGAIPFVGMLIGGYELLMKQIGHKDPRIADNLQALLSDRWFGQRAAEAITRGIPQAYLGVSLADRLQVGSPMSNLDLQYNPLAAIPALGIAMDGVMTFANRERNQQPYGAAAALMPAPIRNPYQALVVYPREGVRTQYQRPNEPDVVPPEGLDWKDRFMKGLGYTPSPIERAYLNREFQKRVGDAYRQGREGQRAPRPYIPPERRVPGPYRQPSPYPQ